MACISPALNGSSALQCLNAVEIHNGTHTHTCTYTHTHTHAHTHMHTHTHAHRCLTADPEQRPDSVQVTMATKSIDLIIRTTYYHFPLPPPSPSAGLTAGSPSDAADGPTGTTE